MEADWSVEIGDGQPVIAIPWEGFVDLREDPLRVSEIPEAAAHPALAEFLIKLNEPRSPVFTSKCDIWRLDTDEIDPFEFDAGRGATQSGTACYIDMVARDNKLFCSFALHEGWVKATAHALRKIVLSQSRVDFVVRQSFVGEREGFAITLYVAACGPAEAAVQPFFRSALNQAIAATIESSAIVGE